MSDLVDRLRDFNKSEAVRMEAADRLEQLERVLSQALATLKDGDMDMVHATIAAIDEALNTEVDRASGSGRTQS